MLLHRIGWSHGSLWRQEAEVTVDFVRTEGRSPERLFIIRENGKQRAFRERRDLLRVEGTMALNQIPVEEVFE